MTKSSVSFHKAFNRLKDQCDGDSLISVIVNNRQKFFIFDRLPSSELDYFKYFSKNVSRFISSFMTEEDFNSFRKGARSVKLGSKSTQGDQEPSVIMHYPHEREGKGKYCSLCNSVYSNYKQVSR